MSKLVNRAKMTTATTGTGTITLGAAVSGYQTFAAAGVADGDVVRYVIEDNNDWELGTGTYTASGTTLSRTVAESSDSGNALNLSGAARVFVSATAADVQTSVKITGGTIDGASVGSTTPAAGAFTTLALNGTTLTATASQINAASRALSTVAALLADTDLTYTAGQPGTVTAGEIVRTRAEGFSYSLAASSATDHHVTTAGGVKLYVLPPFNVKAFGAVGDGVTDDSAAIQAALAAGATVIFPAGSYYLGEYNSSSDVIFQLNGQRYDLIAEGDVEFVVRTSAGVGVCSPVVFSVYDAEGSTFGAFAFRDLGYDDAEIRGLTAYRLSADASSGTWGGVKISFIKCTNCVSTIAFEGADPSNRVRGIYIGAMDLYDCYYGVNARNQGDDVEVGFVRSELMRRVYFVYGCSGHRARIADKNPKGSTGNINISRAPSGFDTENIEITYSCRGSSPLNSTFVNINHVDLLGGTIKGIRLKLDIDVDLANTPVAFINYGGSGGSENSGPSPNIVDDVEVTGSFGSASASLYAVASYGSRGRLNVTARGATFTNDLKDKFLLDNDDGSWTPVLADGSLDPNEGQTASVAVGRYSKRGNLVTFWGRLRMTSLGSLNVTQAANIIGLPYTAVDVPNLVAAVSFGFGDNLNIAAADPITGFVNSNPTRISLQKWSATTGTAGLSISEISLDGDIAFSGSYYV